MRPILLMPIAVWSALAATASAQENSPDLDQSIQKDMPGSMKGHSRMQEMMPTMQEMMRSKSSARTPAAKSYIQVMDRMNKAMAIEFSGDAGADFARMMIPHHQGALDMAQIASEEAEDDELRRIAKKTMDDQRRDIEELRKWLEKHKSAARGSSAAD